MSKFMFSPEYLKFGAKFVISALIGCLIGLVLRWKRDGML